MGTLTPALRPKQTIQPGFTEEINTILSRLRLFLGISIGFMVFASTAMTFMGNSSSSNGMPKVFPFLALATGLGNYAFMRCRAAKVQRILDALPDSNVYELYTSFGFKWKLSRGLLGVPISSGRATFGTKGVFIPFPIACAWSELAYLTIHTQMNLMAGSTGRLFLKCTKEVVEFASPKTTDCFLRLKPEEFCGIFCDTITAAKATAVFASQKDTISGTSKLTCCLKDFNIQNYVVRSGVSSTSFARCSNTSCPVQQAFAQHQYPPDTFVYVGEAENSPEYNVTVVTETPGATSTELNQPIFAPTPSEPQPFIIPYAQPIQHNTEAQNTAPTSNLGPISIFPQY